MIKTHTCYTVACDVCDETPESAYSDGQDHFDSPDGALEDAREGEWWATETAVLCDDRDDDHLPKAREVRAALGDFGIAEFDAWAGEAWCEQFEAEAPRFVAAMPGQAEIPVTPGPVER